MHWIRSPTFYVTCRSIAQTATACLGSQWYCAGFACWRCWLCRFWVAAWPWCRLGAAEYGARVRMLPSVSVASRARNADSGLVAGLSVPSACRVGSVWPVPTLPLLGTHSESAEFGWCRSGLVPVARCFQVVRRPGPVLHIQVYGFPQWSGSGRQYCSQRHGTWWLTIEKTDREWRLIVTGDLVLACHRMDRNSNNKQ